MALLSKIDIVGFPFLNHLQPPFDLDVPGEVDLLGMFSDFYWRVS